LFHSYLLLAWYIIRFSPRVAQDNELRLSISCRARKLQAILGEIGSKVLFHANCLAYIAAGHNFLLSVKQPVYSQAMQVISQALVWVEGAYSSALAHARRIVELASHDHTNKEAIIFLNHCPDHLVDDGEAAQIAFETLEKDSYNRAALQTLQDIDDNVPRPENKSCTLIIADSDFN
jgi:hypothetical protein